MAKGNREAIPTKGLKDGLQYESLWEYGFICWVMELQKEGFIKLLTRSGSYELAPKAVNTYTDEKGKKKTQSLLIKCAYEPDFVIVWNAGWEAFVWDADSDIKKNRPLVGRKDENGDMVTVIEIKPLFDRNNSLRIVADRIKFLFAKTGVFVNLVQPDIFFEETFPPKEWLLTPTGLPKKMKYTPRTFFEYLKTMQ